MKKEMKKIAAPYSKKKILHVPQEFPEGPFGAASFEKEPHKEKNEKKD
ncbi:hypothetical protein AB4Y30_12025 [Ornithinibacillus sp. 4-3]|uniref:Competence protein n=1 Tax=Ornithinibacillus sp. 4-3 TaxID=3231488 RepID=A0AB39HI41_9BACI